MDINLVEENEFSTRVDCQLPGKGVDTWKPFSFTATFRVVDEDEAKAAPFGLTTRDALRDVLIAVEGVPPAKITRDGVTVELTPVEVVIANQFTADAALAKYRLHTTKNARDINAIELAKAANTRGNSGRSRGR